MSQTRRIRGGSKKPRSSAKRSYRKRVRSSKCRGMKTAKCRNASGCKMAFGKKRSFCRKVSNTHRRRASSKKSSK